MKSFNAGALVAALMMVLMVTLTTSLPVQAQTKGAPASGAAPTEAQVRTLVEQRLGNKPNSVTRTPFGWWEVVIGTEIFYVDPQVDYVFGGQVYDAKSRANLTQVKKDELLRVDFKTLPLEQAVKIVNGNGSRVFVTFEDPNCSFCRKLHADMAGLKDYTLYVFLYPILSQDSFEKSRQIWCTRDRAKAWNEWILENKSPPAAAEGCKHPLQDNVALGQKIGVSGTPTLIFTDGSRLPGAAPPATIEERFAAARASTARPAAKK
jgi:thiol:disulfide interchange protein DsbC